MMRWVDGESLVLPSRYFAARYVLAARRVGAYRIVNEAGNIARDLWLHKTSGGWSLAATARYPARYSQVWAQWDKPPVKVNLNGKAATRGNGLSLCTTGRIYRDQSSIARPVAETNIASMNIKSQLQLIMCD